VRLWKQRLRHCFLSAKSSLRSSNSFWFTAISIISRRTSKTESISYSKEQQRFLCSLVLPAMPSALGIPWGEEEFLLRRSGRKQIPLSIHHLSQARERSLASSGFPNSHVSSSLWGQRVQQCNAPRRDCGFFSCGKGKAPRAAQAPALLAGTLQHTRQNKSTRGASLHPTSYEVQVTEYLLGSILHCIWLK